MDLRMSAWLTNQWQAQSNARMVSYKSQEEWGRQYQVIHDTRNERDAALAQLAELKKQLEPPETEAEWVAEHSHLATAAGAKAKDAEPDEHELPYPTRQAHYAKTPARPLEPLVAARPIGHQPPRRAWNRQERKNLTGEAPDA